MDSFHSPHVHDLHSNAYRITDSADLIWFKQQYYWERVAVQFVRTTGSSSRQQQAISPFPAQGGSGAPWPLHLYWLSGPHRHIGAADASTTVPEIKNVNNGICAKIF